MTTWQDPPEAANAPISDGGTNPIHVLLDEWRLPRTETRAAVMGRVGISTDPTYHWDTLVLQDTVALPGALGPWTAGAHDRIPPQFPITRFSSLVWHGRDAHRNLHRTADFLATSLGTASVGKRGNTLVASWRSGIAEISLTAWPPEWQSDKLSNLAQERDHKLRTACHVQVISGFRLGLSARERTWIGGLTPLIVDGDIGVSRTVVPGIEAPNETQLEYVRDPENLVDSRSWSLGVSALDEALIVVSNQLFIIPRHAIIRLEVTRLTPAKGRGGSTITAICRTKAPSDHGQSIVVAQKSDPDGLNAIAQHLGDRFDCAVQIEPSYPDC